MNYLPLQKVSLHGLPIAYRVQGQGPDIILIHGWVSSSRMWALLMDELAPQFRCWALDLPGFADSAKPPSEWYSIENYAQLVSAFAAHFNLARYDLIGHSMGGMIALHLGATQPQQVRRLVAINPVVTGRVYFNVKKFMSPRLSHTMLTMGRWFWPWASSDLLRSHHKVHVQRLSEEWQQAEPHAAAASARALSEHDLTPLLPTITAPTLILLGKRDLAAPNAEGKLAAERIAQAQLHILAGGHLVTDDLPDLVQARVKQFLQPDLQLV